MPRPSITRSIYKYGVKVTPNVKESIKFDNDNGNTLWKYEISKETDNIKDLYTFSTLKRGFKDTYDHEFVPVHMCFDVESDLRKKS